MPDPFAQVSNDIHRRLHQGLLHASQDAEMLMHHIDLASRLGKDAVTVQLINLLSLISIEVGQLQDGEQFAAQAYTRAEALRLPQGMAQATANIASITALRGDYPQACRYYQNALSIRQSQDVQLSLAKCCAVAGNLATTREIFESLHHLMLKNEWDYKLELVDSFGLLAELSLATRDYAHAWEALSQAEHRADDLRAVRHLPGILLQMARLAEYDVNQRSTPTAYHLMLKDMVEHNKVSPLVVARAYYQEAFWYLYRRDQVNALRYSKLAHGFFVQSTAKEETALSAGFEQVHV